MRTKHVVVLPYGHYLTKSVWDKETIIYAELDMNLPAPAKWSMMQSDVMPVRKYLN